MRALRLAVLAAGLLLPALAQAQAAIPLLTVEPDTGGGSSYSVSLQILLFMTVLSLLPAALLAMTSFTRIIVVLAILRQSASLSMNPDNSLGWGIVNAEVAVASAIAVSVNDEAPVADFRLSAYPNPFAQHVTFTLEMDSPGSASLAIYDLLGREVARPVQSDLAPGEHVVMWNGSGLAAGVYVYVATTPSGTRSGRLVRI